MSPRKSLPRPVLVAALTLAGLSLGGATVMADEAGPQASRTQPPIIITRGEGEVRARPDSLRTDVGVEADGTTLDAARTEINGKMQKALDALHALGIPGLVLETRVLQFNPIYPPQRGNDPPVIIGYRATNRLVAMVRHASTDELGDYASKLIDAAANAGANLVGGVDFFLADPQDAHGKALSIAVKNAERDAMAMAQAAGVTVIGLQSLEEAPVPRVVPYALSLESRGTPTPIEVGETTVRSSVTAHYLFR